MIFKNSDADPQSRLFYLLECFEYDTRALTFFNSRISLIRADSLSFRDIRSPNSFLFFLELGDPISDGPDLFTELSRVELFFGTVCAGQKLPA